jgi:hypothetical protein
LIDKYPGIRHEFLFVLVLFSNLLLAAHFEILYHIRTRFVFQKIEDLFA